MTPLLWLVVVYSSVFTIPFIAITPWAFPYTGIALSLSIVLSIVFFARKKRTAHERGLFLLSLLMSVLFILRASPIQTFLLFCGVVWAGSYLVVGANHPLDGLLLPFRAFLAIITTKNRLITNIQKVKDAHSVILDRLLIIVEISLITTGTIFLALILLSGTNPYFDALIKNTGSMHLYAFLKKIVLQEAVLPILIVRLFAWVFLFIVLPKTVSFLNQSKQKKQVEMNLPLLIPLAVLVAIIFVFFATQLTFYFAPQTALYTLGYTNSRYAREVFAQLIGLSAVSILLIWYAKLTKLSRLISILLLTEGLFLSFIAFRSVYAYNLLYGLTQKRVFGYAGVIWILLILIYILYRYIRTNTRKSMMSVVFIISICVLTSTVAINIDRMIYTLGKPKIHNTIDYAYLSRLSTDANHYQELLPIIMWSIEKEPTTRNVAIARELLFRTQTLTDNVQGGDWRSFNAANSDQYRAIKNVPLDEYIKILNDSSMKLSP